MLADWYVSANEIQTLANHDRNGNMTAVPVYKVQIGDMYEIRRFCSIARVIQDVRLSCAGCASDVVHKFFVCAHYTPHFFPRIDCLFHLWLQPAALLWIRFFLFFDRASLQLFRDTTLGVRNLVYNMCRFVSLKCPKGAK